MCHNFSVILALSLGVGCGSQDQETQTETNDTNPTSTETSATTETDTDTALYSDKRINWGDVQNCDDPADSVTYTDISNASGLKGSFDDCPFLLNGGGALGVDDLDLDGDLDVILGYSTQPPSIYWNDGNEQFSSTVLSQPGSVVAIGIAHLNNDKYPDLLFGAQGRPGAVFLHEDATVYTQVEIPEWSNDRNLKEFAPNDIDRDGDMDLYALIHGTGGVDDMSDIVLWNDGLGGFTPDESYVDRVIGGGQGFDAGWADFDDDGDMDVYVCNDFGMLWGSNAMIEYEDGALIDKADCDCNIEHYCMGVDFADWNNDGIMDFFLTDASSHKLMQGLGDGSFVDAAASVELDHISGIPEMAWGAVFVDWNNDGDQDILMAMGLARAKGETDKTPGEGIVLMDQRDGTFVDVAPSLGFDLVDNYRSVVAADFNDDGILDILATDIIKKPRFYLSDQCTTNGWLSVHAPQGSKVEVRSGDKTWVDWVTRDASQGAAQPAIAHFGLGDKSTIDFLKIDVPGWSLGSPSTKWITLLHEGKIDAQRVVTIIIE